jgi:DNA polymerase
MLTIDVESRGVLDVTDVGPHIYWEHPSTEALCLSIKEDDTPTKLWVPIFPDPPWEQLMTWHNLVEAYNVMFEKCFWYLYAVPKLGWPSMPYDYWRCAQAKAAIHKLPRSLDGAAKALELINQKDAEGHRVMMQLAKPRKPSKKNPNKWFCEPEKFLKLYPYNIRDVDAEHELSSKLSNLSEYETEVWKLDQRMNEYGVCVDLPAIKLILSHIEKLSKTFEKQIFDLTNGEVERPTMRDRIIKWCAKQGHVLPNVQKGTVSEHLKHPDTPDQVKKILKIRQLSSYSSIKKYQAMANRAHPQTHRVRDALVYHNAGPGRWGGKGIQPHNYPRNALKPTDVDNVISLISSGGLDAVRLIYGPPLETLSRCLRGMIIAPEGSTLLCNDYSSIEARGTAWVSRQKSILEVFRQGLDIYRYVAGQFLGVPYDQVTKEQRAFGKPMVLGLGYGMRPNGFKNYCLREWGREIPLERAKRAVEFFENLNPLLVKYWKSLDRCVTRAVQTGQPQYHDRTVWYLEGDFLFCQLPSGRRNAYYKPRIYLSMSPHGGSYPRVRYWHVHPKNKQWCETEGWYGKWTENVVQATARDVMVFHMLELDRLGFRIVLTVHDEILIEYPHPAYAERALAEMTRVMTTPPPWAPDLPIDVEGWWGKRYRK